MFRLSRRASFWEYNQFPIAESTVPGRSICPSLHQYHHCLQVSELRRPHEGSVATAAPRVHICAAAQKQPHQLQMSPRCRPVQHGVSFAIKGVHGQPATQQQQGQLAVALPADPVQWVPPVVADALTIMGKVASLSVIDLLDLISGGHKHCYNSMIPPAPLQGIFRKKSFIPDVPCSVFR
ncbi:hypothetical protein PR048_020898 [Dryococelus australis]|uniref:Uncharacterized protein n=1 Tax=Dryococelus australis TaxID=614101 RepID=A0ABQ9GWP4_9NEOP|nr:hypothetical protein PR048_020898 [Dryococelus australis]